MISDESLDAEQVAQELGVAKNTVYRLAKSGALPSYRIGKKLRFNRSGILQYLSSNTTETPGEEGASQQLHGLENSMGMPILDVKTIAGSDSMADSVSNLLGAHGYSINRNYTSSYLSLVYLYMGEADACVVHLYDHRSHSYNIPYVRSLVPGTPLTVIRLASRRQGFIVRDGNPLHLRTWRNLLTENVRLANLERGHGSRVLLDESLLAMEMRPSMVEGYEVEFANEGQVAAAILDGIADVGIGDERLANSIPGLEFVPLETEWLDIVVRKDGANRTLANALRSILTSEHSRHLIQAAFGDSSSCDTSHMGNIVYEC